jgi:hypothetical protein
MCEIGEACLGDIRTRDIYTSKQKLKRNVCLHIVLFCVVMCCDNYGIFYNDILKFVSKE